MTTSAFPLCVIKAFRANHGVPGPFLPPSRRATRHEPAQIVPQRQGRAPSESDMHACPIFFYRVPCDGLIRYQVWYSQNALAQETGADKSSICLLSNAGPTTRCGDPAARGSGIAKEVSRATDRRFSRRRRTAAAPFRRRRVEPVSSTRRRHPSDGRSRSSCSRAPPRQDCRPNGPWGQSAR